MDSPKNANDIWENCTKGTGRMGKSLNYDTFTLVLADLYEREMIRRIGISKSRFAYELTPKGKEMFQVVYMPANQSFIDLFFGYLKLKD